MESGTIRKPAFAGSFYPAEKVELTLLLEKYFASSPKISEKNVKALIVPHAGYIYSGLVASWGFKQLPKENKHFVLIGPSHNFPFQGLALSNTKFWATPLGTSEHLIPRKLSASIFKDNQIHASEHSLEVEVPFLQYHFKKFSITCFLTGLEADLVEISHYLLETFPNSIYIFSSDLSHYLPEKVARQKDKKTIQEIINLNADYLLAEDNIACGNMGIAILTHMAKIKNWQGRLVKYDTSATTSYDKGAVVGYASIIFK